MGKSKLKYGKKRMIEQKNKFFIIGIFILMIVLFVNFVSAAWWDQSWIKRQEVSISNVGSSVLNDFTAYINVTYDSSMQADYEDLRFMNGSCSEGQSVQLAHEIENYTSGSALVWVRVLSIPASGVASICMYYGNSGASSGENATGAWINYSMVYHFNEPSGTTGANSILDSTGNTNGTPSAGISLGNVGKIGSTADFSSGTGIGLGVVGSSVLTAETTISFWLYSNNYASPSRQNPFDQAYGGWGTMTLETSSSLSWYFGNNGGDGSSYGGHASGALVTNGAWIYVTAVRDPNGYTYKWYKNGAYLTGSTYSSTYPVIADQVFTIGDGYVNPINGKLDEFRVSTVARSADWINQEYQFVMNQGSYVIFGAEEDADVTPPSVVLNAPVNNTNTSSQTMEFNFTAIEDYAGDMNCSIYLDNALNQTNLTVLNNTLTSFNITGISGGAHTWYVGCADIVGNFGTSITNFFYRDIYPPTISEVTYSPNSSDDLDPGTVLEFKVNVSDAIVNVSTVIFQYYNGSVWENSTMTSPNSDGEYNTTITTISSEANYTYRIWRNDTFGNSRVSVNQTFASVWDCSWSVSPSSLEETIGFYEDKPIGNITIINTGDSNYTDNNCSIIFSTSYNGFSSNYWSSNSWISNNRGFQISSSIIVNASSNETFQINASFPSASSPFTETPAITLTANINNSVTGNQTATVSSTVITSPPNPLLYQEITDYPTTFIYLTPGSFNLSAYVRNLGGDDSDGNTAYNISFNWTLPSSLSSRISEGDTNVFYSNFTNNSKQFKNLTINFTPTNILSMSKGTLNITLYSYGYNNNSELITNSGNQTLLNNTINIQFLCYDGSDGLCVSDCGVGVDPDCVAPSAGTGAGGGGGAGGGAGTVTLYEESSDTFEVLRGDVQKFTLPIKNTRAGYKRDIEIKVSGIKSEYISISPSSIEEIGPFSFENLNVTITAPSYFTRGVYELIFSLKGNVVLNGTTPFSEVKKVTLYIVEVERSGADGYMSQAGMMLEGMNSSGLIMKDVLELFNVMNNSYNEVNFLDVKTNYLLLKEIYDSAMGAMESAEELRLGLISAEEKGISVLETKKIIFLAEAAFRRGDYVLAFAKYTEAKMTYALETKGKFSLYYTVKNNPVQSLLALIGFGIFSFGSTLAVKHRLYKRRLKLLDDEEKLLLELMKVVQLETFENNKMSMDEYGAAMSQYEDKLSKAVEEKIMIETKLSNLLKVGGKKKALKQEKERLVELIKELQDKYLNKANVETRIYENMMKSYTEKISDVEGKLTYMDAQEAMSRFKFLGKKKGPALDVGGRKGLDGKAEGKSGGKAGGKGINRNKSLKVKVKDEK